MALIPLLLGGTLAYWASGEPITPKVLPIALNVMALSIILFGNWWTSFAPEAKSGRGRLEPSAKAVSSARKASGAHG